MTHHVGLLVDDVISKYAQNVDCSDVRSSMFLLGNDVRSNWFVTVSLNRFTSDCVGGGVSLVTNGIK